MVYAWIGLLRADVESIPQSVQVGVTDFIGQPLINIRAAGELRDASGRCAGMMMILSTTTEQQPRLSLAAAHS